MRSAEDTLKFLRRWRERLMQRCRGKVERLSEDEFGQLTTLNTMISYIAEE